MKKKQGKKRVRGSREEQEKVRLRVVDYLKKGTGTRQQAADLFALSMDGVQRIWQRYKVGGYQGLYSKKRGAKEGSKISAGQADEVRRVIKDKLPDQLKLPFGLWTREAVKQLLSKRYGIGLSRRQVGRYLQSWGFTQQKTLSKTFEKKPAQVKEWLRKEYPAVKKRATQEKAIIYFGDETGMHCLPQAAANASAGENPVIKKKGQGSLNMISAVNNRSHLQFMVIDGTFDGEVFQTFLQQMIRHCKQKIFFITNGHPACKTKKFNEWAGKNAKKIEVFFLPSAGRS